MIVYRSAKDNAKDKEGKDLKNESYLQYGKYRILHTLGQGGFGITYEAEQVALGRSVAIKEFFMKEFCSREADTLHVTIPSEGCREQVNRFRAKFIKEARMIASFDHAGIVRVLDVFEENGTAYYVMDFLPGGSLNEKVKQNGPFAEALAEKYIHQVADALSCIHERNTVHLDVKPSNILLNAKGEAVLIDFGISKHYDESGGQTSSTPVGISKGYAPLEQGRDGDVSQFKPSTDIYALGATLYYLVTGNVPPEASLVYEDGLDRPNGISERIWHVIEYSMQPRRKDRPQSIKKFLALFDNNDVDSMPKENAVVMNEETQIVGVQSHFKHQSKQANHIHNGHEYVDLGLPSGTLWATCNVGALKPEDYGDYYAWGETETKSKYSWNTLKYCTSRSGHHFSKYVTDSKYGTLDNKNVLDLSDDAAHANWGGSWRMPTDAEWTELKEKCKWAWTSLSGHNGYKVTSKLNGKTIFLPAAGYRYGTSLYSPGGYWSYWSSSLYADRPCEALGVSSSNTYRIIVFRDNGLSVRPVCHL